MQENQTILIPVPADEFRAIRQELQEIKQMMLRPEDDPVLTSQEVMDLLRIKNYSTLWRWEKDGKIKRIDVDGHPRYRRSDIVKLIEKRA